jgi:hypothetical protein
MAKMMSPNTTIWWVPDSVNWNPAAPSAALLTTARNISCAVVSGYTLNATDSDTDDSTSICDGANVELPTYYNYEANITFFRDSNVADITSDYSKAFNFFKAGRQPGWLVRRVGYLSSVAAAATQVVSSYKVISDYPQDVVEDGGPIEFTVPFLPQGNMDLNRALVA